MTSRCCRQASSLGDGADRDWPDQIHALSLGPLHQVTGRLFLIDRSWQGWQE